MLIKFPICDEDKVAKALVWISTGVVNAASDAYCHFETVPTKPETEIADGAPEHKDWSEDAVPPTASFTTTEKLLVFKTVQAGVEALTTSIKV